MVGVTLQTLDGQVRCVTTAMAIAQQFARNSFAVCPSSDRCVSYSARTHADQATPCAVKLRFFAAAFVRSVICHALRY
eukprot:9514653-Alexandrium_andersonii.AAC.1